MVIEYHRVTAHELGGIDGRGGAANT